MGLESNVKERRKRKEQFFQADNAIFDVLLPIKSQKPYFLSVYAYLCRCADVYGECYPSEENIAKKTDMSRRQVIEMIKLLSRRNIISIRKDVGRRHVHNFYRINAPSLWYLASHGAAHALGQVQEMHSNNTHSKNKNIIKREEIDKMRVALANKMRLTCIN